jgi:hypothetical protein
VRLNAGYIERNVLTRNLDHEVLLAGSSYSVRLAHGVTLGAYGRTSTALAVT